MGKQKQHGPFFFNKQQSGGVKHLFCIGFHSKKNKVVKCQTNRGGVIDKALTLLAQYGNPY